MPRDVDLYSFADPDPGLFFVFAGGSLVVAAVAYLLLRGRTDRRDPAVGGSGRRLVAVVSALSILGGGVYLGYRQSLDRFSELRITADEIRLGYRYPDCTLALGHSDLTQVRITETGPARAWTLALTRRDGAELRSTLTTYEHCDPIYSKIQNWMALRWRPSSPASPPIGR